MKNAPDAPISTHLPAAGLRAVFMSGYKPDVVAQRGILDDDVAFVQKPFTLEALATKVREALDG